PPGIEPGLARLELAVLPLHHGLVKRTTRIERASPDWRSGALPPELRPQSTSGRSRTSDRCRRRAALCPLSYGRQKSPRQESNPHLGRTKGACLPLTPRRLDTWSRRAAAPSEIDGDGGSRTRSSSVQARALPKELRPREGENGAGRDPAAHP